MAVKPKTLIYLRRISQILFFILFLAIIGQTRNHSYLEEERTARLEESNDKYFLHTEKSFPLLIITSGLSFIFLLGAFIFLKKKKIPFKEIRKEKNIFSLIIVCSVIFLFSTFFTLILGKSSFYGVSRGSPAFRIPITPLAAWIILIFFIISLILSILLFAKKRIKKKNLPTFERWLYFSSIFICILSLLLIFAIGSYNPDTRFFKSGPSGVPFFSFDKFLYNLDIPSTLFIETSALIGITTSVAARAMTVSIVYILAMLVIALIFGRSFCGWVCPFGTLHHAVSWFNMRFRKKKFPAENFKKNQRFKYILLIIIISASIFGITLTGFFDPFGVFTRSMTIFGFPSARSIFEKQIIQNKNQTTHTENALEGNNNSQTESPYSSRENNSQSDENETQTPPPDDTQNVNPYQNAPDRRSIRSRTPQAQEYEEQADTVIDRRSLRKRRSQTTNEQTRESTRQNPQTSESVISFREKIRKFFEGIIFSKEKRHYDYYVVNGLVFLLLIGLNFFRTRFWCRYICALGALYGVVGKYSLMRIKQNDKCTNCKACAKFCQGASNPDVKDDFKSAECIYCFNCLGNCKFNALDISFGWETPVEKEPKQIDIKKRSLIKGFGAGLASMFLFKTNFFAKRVNPGLVRPPGALAEPDFLSKCIKCGNCIQICPNNFLQPALFEAGLIGSFTPFGAPLHGFCSPTCTLCSHACPTGAIRYLKETDRGYYENGLPKLKIGTAHVNQHRCITFVYQRKCLVCEEHCPTSPKAIWTRDEKVITREGKTVIIGQPVVTPERCIGCGVCEHVCPVVDEPGIRLTNVGETRNPMNDFSLTRQEK